jgi:DNA-binding NarL/FixJ family response regulator
VTSEPVRVVLADDHPMYRYGVAAVLATADEIELVGEASDGRALIALVEAERPDVVLTDLAMPGLDGVSACRQLLARHPELGVLVLTMHADDESLVSALRAGARGYLVKGADKAELIPGHPGRRGWPGRVRRGGRPADHRAVWRGPPGLAVP